MNISDNTPSTGYISWSNVKISYKGQIYTIADGNTNYVYVYWLYSDPNGFYGSNTYPNLSDDDILVFVNKNGVHLTVPNTTILDGSIFVPESIVANALAANSVTAEKIVAGAISADKIAANAIGADKLAVNNLAAISANLGTVNAGTVDISQGLDIANDKVTIDSNGVNVKNGDFTLEDDQTSTKYNASPKRNLIKDHSFELLQSDQNNINADCGTYNWLESLPDNLIRDTPWKRVGSPKIAMVFSTNVQNSLPMFGDQAAVISNSNYYRQYIWDGIASNTKYTISAHFKRQWNVAVCGIPFIQVWHTNPDTSRIVKIAEMQFPAVNNDYSISRHAMTFTTPSNFSQNDMLEVIVSGMDSNWIQCDGVQMTIGKLPAVYEPEDSIWEITKGNYRPIKKQKNLWAGTMYPDDTQTITPTLPLSECQNGWMLEWQKYTVGVGTSNIQFSHTFIPKEQTIHSGQSYSVDIPYNASTKLFKYLFIYDDHIVGHAQNKTDPNSSKVLVAIYEF